MRIANISPKILYSTTGKVIRNPYPGLDRYQKLITCPCLYHVWSTSVNASV